MPPINRKKPVKHYKTKIEFHPNVLSKQKIKSILNKAGWTEFNNAPTVNELCAFLFKISVVELIVFGGDSVQFKTLYPLTPSQAFE
jgi:hypothetical protein